MHTVGTNNDEAGFHDPREPVNKKHGGSHASTCSSLIFALGKLKQCLRLRCMKWEEKRIYSLSKLGDVPLTSMNQSIWNYVTTFIPPTSLIRGLRNNDHFNANEYWLSISSEDELYLSRSAASAISSPILRVLQKMITYGLCQRTTGPLDATILQELIGSNGRLIAEDPAPGFPRFFMPRPPRSTMQDLYERIGSMEIHQGVLKSMSRRQSYHSDMYTRVFEYMAGQYNISLQGAYTPPSYDEEQQ
nr:hypothetical protein [Tanacetum cinerariifolium]